MTLIAATTAAISTFKTVGKLRKTSIELYKYDFVRMYTLLAMYFLSAWLVEIYIKARLFFNDPQSQQQIVGRFFGVSGIIFNFLAERFIQQEQTNNLMLVDNEVLRKFFDEGHTQFKIVYWDVIKLGAIIFVANEWQSFADLKLVNSVHEPSFMTHAVFGFTEFILLLITIERFIPQIQKLQEIKVQT